MKKEKVGPPRVYLYDTYDVYDIDKNEEDNLVFH